MKETTPAKTDEETELKELKRAAWATGWFTTAADGRSLEMLFENYGVTADQWFGLVDRVERYNPQRRWAYMLRVVQESGAIAPEVAEFEREHGCPDAYLRKRRFGRD